MTIHIMVINRTGVEQKEELVPKEQFFMKLPDLCLNCTTRFICLTHCIADTWRKRFCIFVPKREFVSNIKRDSNPGFSRVWNWKTNNKEYSIHGYIPYEYENGIDVDTIYIRERNVRNNNKPNVYISNQGKGRRNRTCVQRQVFYEAPRPMRKLYI